MLCDVTNIKSRLNEKEGRYYYGNHSDGELPPTISRFMGIFSCGEFVEGFTKEPIDDAEALVKLKISNLACANDEGLTFFQIADIIESGKVRGLENVQDLLKEIEDEKAENQTPPSSTTT